jgi:hypothetical protein
MGMDVNHGAFDLALFKALKIFFRIKQGKKFFIPCVNEHIHQIAAETCLVPILVHSVTP